MNGDGYILDKRMRWWWGWVVYWWGKGGEISYLEMFWSSILRKFWSIVFHISFKQLIIILLASNPADKYFSHATTVRHLSFPWFVPSNILSCMKENISLLPVSLLYLEIPFDLWQLEIFYSEKAINRGHSLRFWQIRSIISHTCWHFHNGCMKYFELEGNLEVDRVYWIIGCECWILTASFHWNCFVKC